MNSVLDVPREPGCPEESAGCSENTPQLPGRESGGGKLSSLFLILSLISFLVSSLAPFPPQITKDYLHSVPRIPLKGVVSSSRIFIFHSQIKPTLPHICSEMVPKFCHLQSKEMNL